MKQALEVSPRIEVNKSSAAIDKEIQTLEKQIKQSQNLYISFLFNFITLY